jgi:predicted transposase YdaD
MYDDTCRFLAEHFSSDFASWLLGKSVTLTELQPSELPLDPIRADAQQSTNAEVTLRQAAQRIDQIADPSIQSNLMAASGILAGLKLEEDVIYRILRRDIMQESTVYRSIQRETQEENSRAIALNLLREGLSLELVVRTTGLSSEQVQQLQQQLNEPP